MQKCFVYLIFQRFLVKQDFTDSNDLEDIPGKDDGIRKPLNCVKVLCTWAHDTFCKYIETCKPSESSLK